MGYVPKSAGAQTLLAALRLVLAGEIYVPRLVLDAAPAEEPGRTAGTPGLTPRQVDVLRLLAQGCSNKQIARGLGLAEKSVKAHVTAILRILQVENRTQAAERARNFALV
jgi:DNA-binding NarL/FixJ family response regulator